MAWIQIEFGDFKQDITGFFRRQLFVLDLARKTATLDDINDRPIIE